MADVNEVESEYKNGLTTTMFDLTVAAQGMSDEGFEAFQQSGEDFNGNFLNLNTALANILGTMDYVTGLGLTTISDIGGYGADVVGNTAGELMSSVTKISNNLQNNASFLEELILVAFQDLTNKVEDKITNAVKDMITPPSLADVTKANLIYLLYLSPGLSDILKNLSTNMEDTFQGKLTNDLAATLGKLNGFITDLISWVREKIEKYTQIYLEALEKALNCIDKGPDYVAKYIGLGERQVLLGIDCVLYGGNPIKKMKQEAINANMDSVKERKEKYEQELQELLNKISKTTVDSKKTKLVKKYNNLKGKISAMETRLNMYEMELEETEGITKKDSYNDLIKELYKTIKSKSTIDEKAAVLQEIIKLEAKRDSRNGVVGAVNALKQKLVKSMSLKMATKNAKALENTMSKALMKIKKKTNKVKAKAKLKIQYLKMQALLLTMTLLGL